MRQLTILLLVFALVLSVGTEARQACAAEAAGSFTGTDGADLFRQNCQGCHMPDAKGAKGAGMYPALAGNPLLSAPGGPTFVILNGLRGMPSFDADFTDEQVAAIVNYVISNFGNQAKDRITPQEVRAMRPNPPIVY